MTKIILSMFAAFCVTMTAQATKSLQVTPTGTSSEQVQALDYGSYYFGRVAVNTRSVVNYTVTNTGTEPLDYTGAYMFGMYFDAYHNCYGTLQPRQQCSFQIAYWPAFEGYHTGDFNLDFRQDSVRIHVWGDAYRF